MNNLLHVGTQDVLRKLVQERKLTRQKLAGQFLYCAAARTRKVLADSGGSNAPRVRCFKYALQTRLVDPYQLTVTVCHYPSGASKWNPIDHRLFSEISKNWAGHPLRSYQTILNHIRTTTTDTGLCVTAELVDQEYPRGVKMSDAQFASIALEHHQVQPLRNYTICPRS